MMKDSYRDFESADRFKALLARLGIRQSQLARDIQMDPNTVSRWANGRQRPDNVVWAYLELRAKVKELQL
jgi:transcriptional regulator with XRE-family HTH domain